MEIKEFKHSFKYIALNICIAALASILLVNYVAAAYQISGDSMDNTLKDAERVIVSKLPIKTGVINRFDIVVINKPAEPCKSIIKRVIGLPGEIIEIKEGEVYINNKRLEQPFLQEPRFTVNETDYMTPLLIEPDHYFVMGDNRAVSCDSRNYGPVQAKFIYGKTLFRYWPFSRMGAIK
jgi:signal peptidase I